jgi:hypothetical protein
MKVSHSDMLLAYNEYSFFDPINPDWRHLASRRECENKLR